MDEHRAFRAYRGHRAVRRGHEANHGKLGEGEVVGELPWDKNIGWDANDVVQLIKRYQVDKVVIRDYE